MSDFIIFMLLYFLGLFVASFTIIQVLIIIFFGIPITNKLEKLGMLQTRNPIVRNNFISLVLLSGVALVATLGVYALWPDNFIAMLLGMGTILFFGIGQIGANDNNKLDYIKANMRYFAKDIETVVSKM